MILAAGVWGSIFASESPSSSISAILCNTASNSADSFVSACWLVSTGCCKLWAYVYGEVIAPITATVTPTPASFAA